MGLCEDGQELLVKEDKEIIDHGTFPSPSLKSLVGLSGPLRRN